ncbi:MAG: alpha/beta hydrolase, partial [Deltaproteobacteria bacterium]|nr:alpha/beta hydrolase [Deltaproteobacteria bacterium]
MMRKSIVAVLLALSVCFVLSAGVLAESFPAMPEATAALESDDNATVTTGKLPWVLLNSKYYVFSPVNVEPAKGFIIYPGGNVDATAYAPLAHAIAAKGYLTILVPMPFDLAFFGMKRANKVLPKFNQIDTWAIGGHSLGGVAACGYAQDFDEKIEGVVLWASYPSETFRLDDKALQVVSIYGTLDGLTTLDEIEESHAHLPSSASFVPIEGGNHTQFGWYDTSPYEVQPGVSEGDPGDNLAEISREEQLDTIVEATIA